MEIFLLNSGNLVQTIIATFFFFLNYDLMFELSFATLIYHDIYRLTIFPHALYLISCANEAEWNKSIIVENVGKKNTQNLS